MEPKIKNKHLKYAIIILVLFFSIGFAQDDKNKEAIEELQELGMVLPNAQQQNVEMQDIHTIKALEPVNLPFHLKKILPYILIIILIIAILIFYYIRKNKKKEIIETIPETPPFEIALKKLNELKKLTIDDKKFYFILSFILREYIGNMWFFNAKEMTTEEIFPFFRKIDIEKKFINKTKNFLIESDNIKFAKAIPFEGKREKDIKFVEDFVIKTKPIEKTTDNNA